MKPSETSWQKDLREYARRLEKDYEKSGSELTRSLQESLNGLEEQLNASIRRQERFERRLVKASRRYADAEIAKLVTPLQERIEELEKENAALRSRAEAAEAEADDICAVQSEIIELMKEKLPDLYQDFLRRSNS